MEQRKLLGLLLDIFESRRKKACHPEGVASLSIPGPMTIICQIPPVVAGATSRSLKYKAICLHPIDTLDSALLPSPARFPQLSVFVHASTGLQEMSSQTSQAPLSTSSADSSFEEVVTVQPMHQGNARKPWAKKILQEYPSSTTGFTLTCNRGHYASPTDNIMSPCTKKLQAQKKRHYNK